MSAAASVCVGQRRNEAAVTSRSQTSLCSKTFSFFSLQVPNPGPSISSMAF